ncbi:MAG: hypothetical protein FJW31_25095 [Acidobacteria bacterium]|nr:hypothetical protein [Acidobacteriota bacterium]
MLAAAIPPVVAALTDTASSAAFPENVLGGEPMTSRHFVIHLHGHLTYHLGQINYLHRMLME